MIGNDFHVTVSTVFVALHQIQQHERDGLERLWRNVTQNRSWVAIEKILDTPDLRVDVDIRIDDDVPLLVSAVTDRRERAVDQLWRRGADVNARTRKGRTALMEAANIGHRAIFGQLLKADAYMCDKDHEGADARVLAENNGHMVIVDIIDHILHDGPFPFIPGFQVNALRDFLHCCL